MFDEIIPSNTRILRSIMPNFKIWRRFPQFLLCFPCFFLFFYLINALEFILCAEIMIIGRCNISVRVISNFKIGFLEIHLRPNLLASLISKYFWLKCHLILSFEYVVFWFASFADSEITCS